MASVTVVSRFVSRARLVVPLALLLSAAPGRAEEPPPFGDQFFQVKARHVDLIITGAAREGEARLIIPQRYVVPPDAGIQQGALDVPRSGRMLTQGAARTVIAGLALSASFILLGLWLARRTKATRLATLLLACLWVTLGLGGGVALANMPQPVEFYTSGIHVQINQVLLSAEATDMELQLTPSQHQVLGFPAAKESARRLWFGSSVLPADAGSESPPASGRE